MANAAARPTDGRRGVGRPRLHTEADELRLLIDAGYTALREHGTDLTIQHILAAAGVSTRSFYRHFDSKEALLRAMFRRDAEWAAERLTKRLADAPTPRDAVVAWVDELFSFVRNPRRAERVAVLGSLIGTADPAVRHETATARRLLMTPLQRAIEAGAADGSFEVGDVAATAVFLTAAVFDASGLSRTVSDSPLDPTTTTSICLRALGTR